MKKMNEYGMIVDLAHSSHALMSDILDLDDSQRKLLCFYEITIENAKCDISFSNHQSVSVLFFLRSSNNAFSYRH